MIRYSIQYASIVPCFLILIFISGSYNLFLIPHTACIVILLIPKFRTCLLNSYLWLFPLIIKSIFLFWEILTYSLYWRSSIREILKLYISAAEDIANSWHILRKTTSDNILKDLLWLRHLVKGCQQLTEIEIFSPLAVYPHYLRHGPLALDSALVPKILKCHFCQDIKKSFYWVTRMGLETHQNYFQIFFFKKYGHWKRSNFLHTRGCYWPTDRAMIKIFLSI